jgi:hypothetical protein
MTVCISGRFVGFLDFAEGFVLVGRLFLVFDFDFMAGTMVVKGLSFRSDKCRAKCAIMGLPQVEMAKKRQDDAEKS